MLHQHAAATTRGAGNAGWRRAVMLLLVSATQVHFLCVLLFGQLPRFMGMALTVGYGYFIYRGLLS